MSATIKRYAVEFSGNVVERANGDLVAYANHQASHRYNEKKERALFETWWPSVGQTIGKVAALEAWLACAKSRAKATGCE